MIKIEINHDTEVYELLRRIADGLTHRQPLMRTLAGTLQAAVDENFQSGGRPRWQGLKYREGMPLINTGQLRNSIQPYSDNNTALVGTDLDYAAIHHFGGQTRPHTIRPKYKKALAFGGGLYHAVNHPGSRIPARPFMQLTEQDEDDLVTNVQDYLRGLIDAA